MPKFRKPYFYPKKFDGKTYRYKSSFATKQAAKDRAEELKKQGYSVRVAGDYDWGGRGYNLYVRKRK